VGVGRAAAARDAAPPRALARRAAGRGAAQGQQGRGAKGAAGAVIRAFDPAGMHEAMKHFSDVIWCDTAYECLGGADVLAIVTEWGDFRRPDFEEMSRRMAARTIFDGRNLYSPPDMKARGFAYHSIGTAPV
jgi:UDPglucose 6-dehydrogenase